MNPETNGNGIIYGSHEGYTFVSRAVSKKIESGVNAICDKCDDQIKFRAKIKSDYVIANIYEDGIWKAVVFFHDNCYDEAEQPYGKPFTGLPLVTLEQRQEVAELLDRQ